ncbi:3-beta hydroxysteroid dehydrogenase/isomerase family-domain-containing protein [Mycena leptocephala]|nr:3-beta hydroxysteroid dehydrogenase/isomerase family-domain-containing protein [Mycena leptocephala]
MAASKDVYLVLGGDVFVGRHVVEQLKARGDTVFVFDSTQRHDDVECYSGNICVPDQVTDAIQKELRQSRNLPQGECKGTRCVIEAAKALGVRKLIYHSLSGVIFDGQDIVNGDENLLYPKTALDPYTASRALAEQLIIAANDTKGLGMRTVCIHPTGIFSSWDQETIVGAYKSWKRGIILGIFREIPIVHNLPFTPPVPAWAWLLLHWNWFGIGSLHCLFWAWLLVNPAPVQLCISFNAATLELVQDWQAPLPVPGMVAGKSCACTPMFTLELVRDRQPPLPVPSMVAARSELVQDWWPTLPVPGTVAGESCTHTSRSELAQDRWPTLPVLDTIAGESYTHTRMHNLASYLLLHFGSDRQPPMPVLGTIAEPPSYCCLGLHRSIVDAAIECCVPVYLLQNTPQIRFPNSGGSVWILSPNCAILKASNLSTAEL